MEVTVDVPLKGVVYEGRVMEDEASDNTKDERTEPELILAYRRRS